MSIKRKLISCQVQRSILNLKDEEENDIQIRHTKRIIAKQISAHSNNSLKFGEVFQQGYSTRRHGQLVICHFQPNHVFVSIGG